MKAVLLVFSVHVSWLFQFDVKHVFEIKKKIKKIKNNKNREKKNIKIKNSFVQMFYLNAFIVFEMLHLTLFDSSNV